MIIGLVLLGGGDVSQRDTFLAPTGLQSNEAGMLVSFAVGPLLFIALGSGGIPARLGAGVGLLIVTTGLILTGTRGAMVAFLVIIVFLLLKRRKFSDILWVLLIGSFVFLLTPEAVLERATLGLDNVGATHAANANDPLTMGRFAGWAMLAPDVLVSPLWGRGLGATAWTAAVTAGRYSSFHPHNLYLEILLDMGIIGILLIGYLYVNYCNQFHRISVSAGVSAPMQDFFSGCLASFFGMLAFGITNLHYMPCPEQTYLWFSLGMAFAFWKVALPASTRGLPAKRGNPLAGEYSVK
jgi:O-antigen ligase